MFNFLRNYQSGFSKVAVSGYNLTCKSMRVSVSLPDILANIYLFCLGHPRECLVIIRVLFCILFRTNDVEYLSSLVLTVLLHIFFGATLTQM